MQIPTVKHWALLGYLVLFWGFAFGLIAMALEAFHPVAVVWSRLTLGALVMLLVLRWQKGRIPWAGRWPLRMMLLSITGNVIPFTLIAWAEQRVASGEVGLLMALMPIAILVMGHYFLEHERHRILACRPSTCHLVNIARYLERTVSLSNIGEHLYVLRPRA